MLVSFRILNIVLFFWTKFFLLKLNLFYYFEKKQILMCKFGEMDLKTGFRLKLIFFCLKVLVKVFFMIKLYIR